MLRKRKKIYFFEFSLHSNGFKIFSYVFPQIKRVKPRGTASSKYILKKILSIQLSFCARTCKTKWRSIIVIECANVTLPYLTPLGTVHTCGSPWLVMGGI